MPRNEEIDLECPECGGDCGRLDADDEWVDCETCGGLGTVPADEPSPCVYCGHRFFDEFGNCENCGCS